jgi:hypothetical protein
MMRAELDKAASLAEPNAPAPAALRAPTQPADGGQVGPQPDGLRDSWYSDRIGWAATGTGVMAIGLGLALRSNGASLHDRANDPELPQSERMDLRDRASSRNTGGSIAIGMGAALAVAGVIKLALTDEPGPADRPVGVSLSPGGITVAGRF